MSIPSEESLRSPVQKFAPDLPVRIPSLDGLRTLSILLVIVAHAVNPAAYPVVYQLIGHLGNYGVRMFFVISGFLITSLLLKEFDRFQSVSLGNFYARRAIRIFPAFYFFVATVALLDHYGWLKLLPGDLFHTLTYTMNYHQDRAWPLNHTWSLSVEEQFYLLWPALILWLRPRQALRGAALMILLAPFIRAVMYFYFNSSSSMLGRNFQAVADSLAFGCLLAGFYNRIAHAEFYRRCQNHPLYLILPIALIALSGLAYKLNQPFYYIIGQTVASLGSVLLVDYAVRCPLSAFGRLLNLGICSLLGAWSYSLYLWQEIFLDYNATGLGVPFPLNLLATFAAGLFSYYVIERVFFGLRHRFSR